MAARTDDARGMVAEALACLVLLAVQEGRRFSECLAVTRWGSSRMSFAGYAVRWMANFARLAVSCTKALGGPFNFIYLRQQQYMPVETIVLTDRGLSVPCRPVLKGTSEHNNAVASGELVTVVSWQPRLFLVPFKARCM